jgi:L-ribulose-5-phosphate 3-epimerase
MMSTLSTARAPTINTYGFLWSHRADDTVHLLQGAGYHEFELMLQPPHLSLDVRSEEALALSSMSASGAIFLQSLNMPSLDLNLTSPMPEMRRYSIDMFKRQISLAGALGVRNLIVAPGRISPLFPAPKALLDSWMSEAVAELLPLAYEEGVTLCLENLPIASLPRATDLKEFLSFIGNPKGVGICYDVANAHYVAEDPLEGLSLLKNDLRIVHFSDTRRDKWRHDVIGEGDIDFTHICDILDEIQWTGPLVLEIIAKSSDPLEAIITSHKALVNERHSFGR